MIAARRGRRPHGRAALTLALALGALGLLAVPPPDAPRWVWNTTASAPVGLYVVQPSRRANVGDWVAVAPPTPLAAWLDRRGYVPKGAVLIKQIAAIEPSLVCRSGAAVSLDGAPAAQAQANDRHSRPLPVWSGCRRLVGGEVFLLTAAADSLDSRYFGPLPAASLLGPARPIWVQGGR